MPKMSRETIAVIARRKAGYLVSAGCVALGLGLTALMVNAGVGDAVQSTAKGSKSSIFADSASNGSIKQSSLRKQDSASIAGHFVRQTQSNTIRKLDNESRPAAVQPAASPQRLANSGLSAAPQDLNVSEPLWNAALKSAPLAPVRETRTQASRRQDKQPVAARPAKQKSADPAAVVKIIPAGETYTEQTGDKNDKWYSSFWPLGERKGVVSLRKDYIPFQTEKSDKKAAERNLNTLPDRPELLIEFGDGFLDTGNLGAGFEVPIIGAVWQPRLWAYLINRTAVQSFNNGSDGSQRETEIANRLDAFFNLQLTGTEKILLGLRPTDKNRPTDFTKYTFDGAEEGFNPDFRLGLETLFFEGDVGSLFPVLDRAGFVPLDFGFTVGRQPLIFQEGILINDTIDAVGLIRNNIPFPGTSNFRVSGIWGFNRTDRNDARGGDEQLFGLFTAADTHLSTFNLDLIYIDDDTRSGDGLYGGFAAIQRLPHLGGISSAFRVNASYAVDDEVGNNSLGDGVLFTSELSKTVKGSDDIVYFNSFLNIGNFTQAGREAINGGPLANTGILFASPNLSTYLAEIDPFTGDDVIGGAIGYQAFWDDNRRNLILETAGRYDLSGNGIDSLGFGFQLQQAVGRHIQLQLEAFYTLQEEIQDASGTRAEILFVL